MKTLFILLVCVFSTLTASASHLMGGMITVNQTSSDSTSIGAYLLMDGSGIPSPSLITIEKWEMDSQGWYSQNGYVTLTKSSTLIHQGLNVVTYVSDYINLDSNKYRFIYKNCCWGTLTNVTNSFSNEVVISSDYWHIPNNSQPYMENPLWVNVEQNSVNTMKPVWGVFNCFFTNPDIDSVSIVKSEIYASYSNGVFVPATQSSSNVSANNDSITFVGTNLGPAGYGFEIKDYRNGIEIGVQRIQWTFRVITSTLNIEENIGYRDTRYELYDWSGRYMGSDIKTLNNGGGLYVVRYSDGKMEKINVLPR